MRTSHVALALKQRFFATDEHPYRIFERQIDAILRPTDTLLDAGCGRTSPLLTRFAGRASRLIGIDVVDFTVSIPGVELHKRDIADTGLADASVDLVISRSVVEHLQHPDAVFQEIARILRPGGRFLFLTANRWDYPSLLAWLIPNTWHPWIVARTEGRAEEDVFPVSYRANTSGAVHRLAAEAGLRVASLTYLGQYPNYFLFNGFLFLLATLYEKSLARIAMLRRLRGWILADLAKPCPASPASVSRSTRA